MIRATSCRAALLPALLIAAVTACGDDGGGGDDGGSASAGPSLLQIRERAAAHAVEDQWAEVSATLAPAVAGDDAQIRDLLWAAVARWEQMRGSSLIDQDLAATRALLARIRAVEPDHAGAAWVDAQLAFTYDFDPAAAADHARTVLASQPDDAHAVLFLGRCHQELGELDEARARYEEVRELTEGVDDGLWAVASYKLGQMLARSGDPATGMELINAQADLDKPGDKTLDRGNLAVLAWPEHVAREPRDGPAPSMGIDWAPRASVALTHSAGLRAEDLTGDGLLDVVGFDDRGLSVARATSTDAFAVEDMALADLRDVQLADVDGDTRPDLVSLSSAAPAGTAIAVDGDDAPGLVRAALGEDTAWFAVVADATGVLAVDIDHEGDLDLLIFGANGATLLRNDGAEGGAWAVATPPALADLGAVREAHAEDIDGDNDVDLVLLADDVRVFSNLRGGRFADVTNRWLAEGTRADNLRLADVDHDRHPDLFLRDDARARVFVRVFEPGAGEVSESTGAGRFRQRQELLTAAGDLYPAGAPLLADFDLTGRLDVFDGDGWGFGPILGMDGWGATGTTHLPDDTSAWLSRDLDDDGVPEFLAAGAGQLTILDASKRFVEAPAEAGPLRGLTLHLEGLKDNALGLGAIVELRAGPLYSRHYVRCGRTTLGLDGAATADIVRIVWPNGVAQHLFDVPAGSVTARQPDRASGSCPFLYVFDGTRWHFVTDVLGATPLGLPMAPGQMVPFDHEEYVKVDGPMLQPDADGMLRVALTEELREVTYLDRVRLHAIDHPSDVEIQPDEGFVFPPFPAHHVHTLREAVTPFRAVSNLAADGAHGYGSTTRDDAPDEIPYAHILLPPGSEATHPSMLAASKLTPFERILHTAPHLGVTPEPHNAIRGMVLDLDGVGFRSDLAPKHVPHVWDAATPCDWTDVPDDPSGDASRLAGPSYDAAVAATPAPIVDVAQWLDEADTRCPRPFRLAPDQLQGLTEPWSLDLEFGHDDAERDAIRDAPQLRLALTGWLQWGDASVNMAAARDPDFAFVPPIVWVPDGDGAWRPIGPPVGFPAGKTKTLMVDLTEHLDRDDPRVRITTTLEISWDRIALVVDDDDAPFVDTPVEPAVAELSFRGLSGLVCTGRDDLPEIFDWDVLSPNVPWDAHPGRYTAYGDIAPLLGAVDDEYAILGTGDVAHVTFDASTLPELPAGWTRDWLLYLDGWAKDRDPNTLAAERVEPLPFHGMSAYPPSADEISADREARAAWDAKWNTRDGRRLLPDLRPR